MTSDQRQKSAGFTLIELAVSLFIISLLLGAILVPLATQIEQRQTSETQKTLDEIREALIGYALANGNLPCPDATSGAGQNDGNEDVVAGSGLCQTLSGTMASGNLPWATLGLANQDTWGNRFRYKVLGGFAQRAPVAPFTIATAANLRVCESTACTSVLSSVAVAVIISHGNNGYGAMHALTNRQNPTASAAADEATNFGVTLDTVSATKSTITGFDDIVASLPRFTLVNRMVAAGKLP